jgi:glycosyltransferase involved in cell wall biosynthesis
LVARLVPGKGHRLALEAWEKLAQAVPPAALVLVGDGPLLPGLTEEARRLGRPGREVLCLGYRGDVPAVLRAADALVLPSQAEGLPTVVVEAMAAGLPVVASDLPSLREMVVPGETGLLFDLRSGAEALARALETVLMDPDRARRMGKAGRSRAEALFALHNVAQTVDFLSDMAACRGSARTAEVTDG